MKMNLQRWIGGLTLAVSCAAIASTRAQAPQQAGPVVYEGARLIVGDGKTIDN